MFNYSTKFTMTTPNVTSTILKINDVHTRCTRRRFVWTLVAGEDHKALPILLIRGGIQHNIKPENLMCRCEQYVNNARVVCMTLHVCSTPCLSCSAESPDTINTNATTMSGGRNNPDILSSTGVSSVNSVASPFGNKQQLTSDQIHRHVGQHNEASLLVLCKDNLATPSRHTGQYRSNGLAFTRMPPQYTRQSCITHLANTQTQSATALGKKEW